MVQTPPAVNALPKVILRPITTFRVANPATFASIRAT